MHIELIPAFADNYFPFFEIDGRPIIVDPGDACPVLTRLKKSSTVKPMILVTHYHPDHVGGCEELRRRTGAEVVGPEGDQERLLDWVVREGDVVDIGSLRFRVMEVPGHTYNHIAYVDDVAGVAFVGDTLFAGGCGRVFSGTAEQLWESLKRLRELQEKTLIYCAHEYTLGNLEFACHVEPSHGPTRKRLELVREQRENGIPTVPTTVGEEKRTNIFLRADEPEMAEAVGMTRGTDPVLVFAELRRRKNEW